MLTFHRLSSWAKWILLAPDQWTKMTEASRYLSMNGLSLPFALPISIWSLAVLTQGAFLFETRALEVFIAMFAR